MRRAGRGRRRRRRVRRWRGSHRGRRSAPRRGARSRRWRSCGVLPVGIRVRGVAQVLEGGLLAGASDRRHHVRLDVAVGGIEIDREDRSPGPVSTPFEHWLRGVLGIEQHGVAVGRRQALRPTTEPDHPALRDLETCIGVPTLEVTRPHALHEWECVHVALGPERAIGREARRRVVAVPEATGPDLRGQHACARAPDAVVPQARREIEVLIRPRSSGPGASRPIASRPAASRALASRPAASRPAASRPAASNAISS